MKICSKCGKELPSTTEFFCKHKSGKDGLAARCKECSNIYHREYNARHREHKNKLTNNWRKANPDRVRNIYLKHTYGITSEEYEKLLEEQKGVCLICGRPEKVSDGKGGIKKLHIDHNHTTGKVRGLLCNDCNVGLARFNEDVCILQKAILYLEENND